MPPIIGGHIGVVGIQEVAMEAMDIGEVAVEDILVIGQAEGLGEVMEDAVV
jgi:hypothetical protein